MKIQFASGGNHLNGWVNLEQHNGDITQPLAFKNESVDFVFIEHGLEHVTPQQGYKFLMECFRILKPQGVVRVIVPDIEQVRNDCSWEYLGMLQEGLKTWWPAANWKTPVEHPTIRDAVETLIFCHGHQSIYTKQLLVLLMQNIGFRTKSCEYGCSSHNELNNIDSHHRYMGLENCILESCVVEATK